MGHRAFGHFAFAWENSVHRFEDETIHISDLRVECIIGVHDHERKTPQPLLVSLSFPADFSPAATTDGLGDTVDYGEVARTVREFARQGRFQLLETLARRLAEHLGTKFGLGRLHLHLLKTAALPDAGGAAVSLTWVRGKGEGP